MDARSLLKRAVTRMPEPTTPADLLATIDTLRAQVLALGTTTPPPPPPPPAHLKPRQTLWMSIDAFDELTDADLISLRDDWGCTDLVAQFGYVRGYGGSQQFTTDKAATFDTRDARSSAAWTQCRKVRFGNNGAGTTVGNGNIVARVHALGMRIYHGMRWRSLPNRATPLAPWHDDAAWTALVDPKGAWAERIAYAKAWGFDGLAVDDEILNDGKTPVPTWRWDYAGSPGEAQTRANVYVRGQEFGRMLAAIWPGVEVIEYVTTGHAGFPDDYDENVRQPAAGRVNVKEPLVERDWWDGIFSVPAFTGSLSVLNVFYRGPFDTATEAEKAMADNATTQLARMTQWRSWARAKGRIHINPFIWPGRASNAGEDKPLSVEKLRVGFGAARKFHQGRVGFYCQSLTADRAWFTPEMLAVLRG